MSVEFLSISKISDLLSYSKDISVMNGTKMSLKGIWMRQKIYKSKEEFETSFQFPYNEDKAFENTPLKLWKDLSRWFR